MVNLVKNLYPPNQDKETNEVADEIVKVIVTLETDDTQDQTEHKIVESSEDEVLNDQI